jgi:cobalt-zinc-cadmium efflux system outer membrane protein
MNKSTVLFTSILLAASVFSYQGIVHAQVSSTASLDILVQEALDNNPRIQQAFHEWKASQYRIDSARGLPDPMLSYGYFGESIETRVGPQEQKFGVSQKIPFPGKLRLKGKAQSKHAEILREKHEAVTNEIIKEVKFGYYDLFWVDQAIQINEEEKSILEKLEKVTQRKYESNRIPQQDVIKAQVELSKIIQKLFLLKQNRSSLVARLNSLLNRPGDSDMVRILSIDERAFEYELDELVDKVNLSRQELLAAGLSVEKAEHEKSLAKMAYLPDFTFGAEFVDIGSGTTSLSNDGEDAWMGKVSVNVPIWFGKLKAQVKEKEAALQAAKENKADVENRVEFEVQDIYFKISAYKDIVLLYETALIPQAQQAFDASQTGFETGAISFLDWLDTERTYLQTRLAYYKSITDYHKAVAHLERIVGGNLEGVQDEK